MLGLLLQCPIHMHALTQRFPFGAGTYRQLQARLRANAESVAFYGGIAKEGALLRTR